MKLIDFYRFIFPQIVPEATDKYLVQTVEGNDWCPEPESNRQLVVLIKTEGCPEADSNFGAGGGTRTLTLLPTLDFESSASTSSATPAKR
jgi:hypothetical protein